VRFIIYHLVFWFLTSRARFVSTIITSSVSFSDFDYRCDYRHHRSRRKEKGFGCCCVQREESVGCRLFLFLNKPPRARARRFFSLLRSFLDADQSLSFTTTTTRARACARKSADTTTKAREWCLSAESSRRRNQ